MTYRALFALVRRMAGVPVLPGEAVAADADARASVTRTVSDEALLAATVGALGELARQAKAQYLGPLVLVATIDADAGGGPAPGVSSHPLSGAEGGCEAVVRVLTTRTAATPPGGDAGGNAAAVPAYFLVDTDLIALADSGAGEASAPAFAVTDEGAVLCAPAAASVRVAVVVEAAAPASLDEAVPVGEALLPALAFAACARVADLPVAVGSAEALGAEGAARFFADAYAAALRPCLRRRTSGSAYEVQQLSRLLDREVVTE